MIKKKKTYKGERIPDSRHGNSLIKIGKMAAEQAIRESKAMGLDITYMEKGKLYTEKPDGSRKEIKRKSIWPKV